VSSAPKIFFVKCCDRMHKHPSRTSHNPHKINTLSDCSIINDHTKPESQLQHVNHESSITEDEYDISDSPNTIVPHFLRHP